VRAIRPPSVAPGTSRLRVTVRYPVSDQDLRRFAVEAARLLNLRAA
jgi:7-keto-8-aminopelargonate synthetase-like enzyme